MAMRSRVDAFRTEDFTDTMEESIVDGKSTAAELFKTREPS